MKIKFEGTQTVEQLGHNTKEIVEGVLGKMGVEETPKISRVIVQLAFDTEQGEQYLVTEHDEMLQMTADLNEHGFVDSTKDNQDEPTEDKRLWSHDKLMGLEPTPTPTEAIPSMYFDEELEFIEEFPINSSLTQKVFAIKGEEEKLVRYVNTELDVIVAEEIVAPKDGEA
ncbi:MULTISPECIES: hypothetical protein [unclassified Exiguobacterium]|uniref:hypothetical protein n=1 Tax=unclassified Exiguobacterium TaxID=2644629 RepID=UPI001BE9F732|nr:MULTISPECIES: hypothetical protein [unclassified Exiguobacterium]